MVAIADRRTAERATCAICFREFLLDRNGRLFRHVRRLGTNERCDGYRFEPAGISLAGTLWAIDRAATALNGLIEQEAGLHGKPILGGIGPFDALYDVRWLEAFHALEHRRGQLRDELAELVARFNEWQPAAPTLGPRPIHLKALWRCRAGTEVPLCFSGASRRPSGDPIMLSSVDGVDCPHCIALFNG